MRETNETRWRVWLTRLLCVAAPVTACGGPAVPAEPPAGSPLSARAEEAPLPRIGSSFEDAPLTPEEEAAPAGHQMHGGMRHGSTGAHAGDAGAGDRPRDSSPDHGGGH